MAYMTPFQACDDCLLPVTMKTWENWKIVMG